MKKSNKLLCVFMLTVCIFAGCGSADKKKLEDGTYKAEVTLSGGTGKASVESSAKFLVKDGTYKAVIIWSSKNYDYMIVNKKKYLNENEGGNSTFTIPVSDVDKEITVIADTTAMSVPHEIEYKLKFHIVDKKFSSVKKTGKVKLSYATQFQIEKYEEYKMITTVSGGRYLLIPEGTVELSDIPKDVAVIHTPVKHGYLVATSAMDLIDKIGAMSGLRLSGTQKKDWYVKNAVLAMEQEKLLYAGKYNTPDYEKILSEKCDLAIESTMIYHNPEVKEKLEKLHIPVLVERSSYEESPLGRLEWIKLYGELFGKQKEAESFFNNQIKKVLPVIQKKKSNCSAVFFYITSTGSVVVRKPNDYISKMIELAGGKYILSKLEVDEENALSTTKMQMEDFYSSAKDADVIIYNSTIDGELKNVEDLKELNSLFGEFKAVKNGNVYCTSSNFFQESTGVCDFINDLNNVFTGRKNVSYRFLKELN